MKRISLILLAAVLLISCDNNTVYKKLDTDFADNRWQQSDVKTYAFTIPKDGNYDLVLNFSHVGGFQFDDVPMIVTITNPDQTTTTEKILLDILDTAGSDLGDCSGDYCDLQQDVFTNKALAAGNYKVTLRNEFNNAFLPNVLAVGIHVDAAKPQ